MADKIACNWCVINLKIGCFCGQLVGAFIQTSPHCLYKKVVSGGNENGSFVTLSAFI